MCAAAPPASRRDPSSGFHVKQTGPTPLSPSDFQDITGVPGEALARLETYVALLEKWQSKVNLVGSGSLGDVWRRHILDSAQIGPHLPPPPRVLVDIGSGAGFPGLVLAIVAGEDGPEIHLVESNQRKCVFLREVVRATGTKAAVHNCRIENFHDLAADVVTARGVAPLEKLLEYANPVLKKDGQCFFLKGKNWREELTKSKKNWIIRESHIQSLSDSSGVILKLEALSRRHDP